MTAIRACAAPRSTGCIDPLRLLEHLHAEDDAVVREVATGRLRTLLARHLAGGPAVTVRLAVLADPRLPPALLVHLAAEAAESTLRLAALAGVLDQRQLAVIAVQDAVAEVRLRPPNASTIPNCSPGWRAASALATSACTGSSASGWKPCAGARPNACAPRRCSMSSTRWPPAERLEAEGRGPRRRARTRIRAAAG